MKKKAKKKVAEIKPVTNAENETQTVEEFADESNDKMENVRKGRARTDLLRKTIQGMLPKGLVDDLQLEVLQNWAEMLQSDDMHIWAVATKELSKYLFPQKREHQVVPSVNINCTFTGIMTQEAMGGKVINHQSDTSVLEQVKTDLLAQVSQIDILLYDKKGDKK